MKTYIENIHVEQAIKGIERLVAIPSYLQEPVENAPFGVPVRQCLTECLALFKEEGFEVYEDPEGYYGYAEIGQGEKTMGILCHLDVVPPGDLSLWKTNPFEAVVTETSLIGRGVQDDKGPSMAALYAVKALRDAGVTFQHKIRFIFGTDEENLWRCMSRYHEKEEQVDFGFVPDSKFPVIYAEKGLLQVYFEGPSVNGYEVSGGSALNVVPDEARFRKSDYQSLVSYFEKQGWPYQVDEDEDVFIAKGRAIHSKSAPDGVNAISRLMVALDSIQPDFLSQLLGNKIGEDANGLSLFGHVFDEMSGDLTFNVATLSADSEKTTIGLDIRMPVTTDKELILTQLEKIAQKFGFTCHEHDYLASLYVPKESELVQTLLQTYRDMTGDLREPQVNGGATYARAMKNCVAFGAMFKDTKDTMHQPNETWQRDELEMTMKIYAEAIYRLQQLDVS